MKHGSTAGVPASHLCNSGNSINRVHAKRIRHWFFFRYYWRWRGGVEWNSSPSTRKFIASVILTTICVITHPRHRLCFQRCQCDFISPTLNIVSDVQAAYTLFDFFNQFFVGERCHVLVLILLCFQLMRGIKSFHQIRHSYHGQQHTNPLTNDYQEPSSSQVRMVEGVQTSASAFSAASALARTSCTSSCVAK
ncbi:hypothetical protein ExPECSC029_04793 [Escherichia coli]|nr:hypothetical protein ExPECSC029_04793 [Escherichia coli]